MSENIQKSPLPCGGGLGVGETQSIKQGYKQTSLGILPQEWEVVRLGEVGDIVGGGTPDTTNSAFWNGEIAWISSSDIDEESIYKISIRRFINEFAIKNSATNLIPAKSVLIISRVGVGKVAVNEIPLCTSQDTQSLILKNAHYIFMAYLIKHNIKTLLQYNQGTSIQGFTKTELKSLQIPLPPLAEQEKIAQILSVWDKGISVLKSLIEAKTKRKKALMQRLLTPPKTSHTDFSSRHSDKVCHTEPFSCHTERSEVSKNKGVDFVDTLAFSKHQYDEVLDSCNSAPLCHTEGVARSIQKDDLQGNAICLDSSVASLPQNDRGKLHNVKNKPNESSLRFAEFTDKWQEFRFNDIFIRIPSKKYQIQTKEYQLNGKYPVIDQGQTAIIGYSNNESKVFKNSSVIVFGDHTRELKFIDFDFIVGADGVQLLRTKDEFNDRFFYYQLQIKKIPNTGYNRHFKFLLDMPFACPTLTEQKKIAQVLSACDKEIELLKSKFQCLKTQKKGLMQRLLNGEVRVKC